MMEVCICCDKDILAREEMYKCRSGISCGSSVRLRPPRRVRQYVEDYDDDDDEDDDDYDEYPYTTCPTPPPPSPKIISTFISFCVFWSLYC